MDPPGSEFMCRSASLYENFEAADPPQPVEAVHLVECMKACAKSNERLWLFSHHVAAVDTGETHREARQEKDQKDSEDQSERWPKRQP